MSIYADSMREYGSIASSGEDPENKSIKILDRSVHSSATLGSQHSEPQQLKKCLSIENFIKECHQDPKIVAKEFKTFFISIQSEINISDLLSSEEEQKSLDNNHSNSGNYFIYIASLIDKLSYHIIYDILHKKSRHSAENRFALYLEVAMCALQAKDTATAMCVYAALAEHSIQRLNLIGKRFKKHGCREHLGFNKTKKGGKLNFETKNDYYELLSKTFSPRNNFKALRAIENQDIASPHVLALFCSDLAIAKETQHSNPSNDKITDLMHSFQQNLEGMKSSENTLEIDIESFLASSALTPEDVEKRSYEIKAPKSCLEENWHFVRYV